MPSHLDFSQGCTAIDDLNHCSACACGYMRPPSKGWFLGWLSGARGDRVPSGHISQSPSRPPIRRSRDTVRHGPTARWRDHGLPPVFEPERARPTRVPSFSPRLMYTCEPTTHRSVRMVFLPTPHHRAECLWEPPAAAWFGAGSPRGIAPPGLPQIQTCPIKASGSSCHVLATGRHTEWTAIAGGSG